MAFKFFRRYPVLRHLSYHPAHRNWVEVVIAGAALWSEMRERAVQSQPQTPQVLASEVVNRSSLSGLTPEEVMLLCVG